MTKTAKTDRTARTGSFVIGQRAFTRISAVEGIKTSKRLQADLRDLEQASSDDRRAVLTQKYGSNS